MLAAVQERWQRAARLQYDEFIATSGNNNEFISARASQIDLIGTGVGKSAAKGPGA